MPTIRLIAMDVDGTLMHRGKISPANLEALREAQKRGITVAIATGRLPANLHEVMNSNGLYCPVMGINGCHITDEHCRTISERFMPRDTALRAVEVLMNAQTEFNVDCEGMICISREDAYFTEADYYSKLLPYGMRAVFGRENAPECAKMHRVHKLFAYNCADVKALRAALSGIPGLALSRSSPANIEIMPVGVDKGTGVRELAGHYGIRMEDVMTLGDEMNDLPMIESAGWGIAMGNAAGIVKERAKYVTESCKNDGVARAIWRYAL